MRFSDSDMYYKANLSNSKLMTKEYTDQWNKLESRNKSKKITWKFRM